MPIDYKEYPPDWKAISKLVILEAGNKCELCFAKNHTKVIRFKDSADDPMYPWFPSHPYQSAFEYYYKVRHTIICLTVHHIDSNKMNSDRLNLIALCQRCHLRLDMAKHVANRKASKP